MRPIRGILQVLGISRGFLPWLIRDEFNDTDASPINAPRAAVPGPGTLDFIETDGSFAIGSGILEFTAPAAPAYDVLRFESVDSFSRHAGRTLVTEIQIDGGDSALLYLSDGSGNSATLDDIADGLCFYFEAGGEIHVVLTGGTSLADSVGNWSTGVPYKIAITQLDEGAMYHIKGGAYTNWKLLFVYTEGLSNTLYPAFTVNNADGSLNYFRFWDATALDPLFSVSPGQFTQSLAATEINDGGFELWSSATNATQWTESLNGTSSVNRESTDIDAGVYAARLDVDGSGSDVSVSQFLSSGNASDLVEVLGYMKSEPTGASMYINTDQEQLTHIVTDAYHPYTDLLRTGAVASEFSLGSTDSSSSLYYDNFSVRRMTENALQTGAANSIIDFEFILPDTPSGLMLMQAMNENFFLFLYRLVLGLLKTLLKG